MPASPAGRSRRQLLRTLSAAAGVGLAGCSGILGGGGTSTDSPTPTPTATPTPNRPSIERQLILRDRAAVTHIRRTVTGEISWPAYETFNIIDPELLGQWQLDDDIVWEFYDDATFRDIRPDVSWEGTYFTIPHQDFLRLEYEDGDILEYHYDYREIEGDVLLDVRNTDDELLGTFEQTVDAEDSRGPIDYFRAVVVYRPETTGTTAEQIDDPAGSGTGFVVSPDGHMLTNAHVVGTHRNQEEDLFYLLALRRRQEIRSNLEADFDLSESEREQVVDILFEKLFDYLADHSRVTDVSTNIGVLHGTASPDEEFEARSWPASVEATGSVYEEVSGEPTWGRDVAVLKVDEPHPLPTVPLGDSTDLGTGEPVVAIGYPDIGLEELFTERNTTLEPSLTSGVVSARRTLNSGIEAIQTDLDLNPGNSGGPVYDGEGNVVGIATFRPPNLDLAEVSFALPIETASSFLDEAGVEPGAGELDTAYRDGLEALWRGDCETVTEQMQTVLDLWSGHPYAETVMADC